MLEKYLKTFSILTMEIIGIVLGFGLSLTVATKQNKTKLGCFQNIKNALAQKMNLDF